MNTNIERLDEVMTAIEDLTTQLEAGDAPNLSELVGQLLGRQYIIASVLREHLTDSASDDQRVDL